MATLSGLISFTNGDVINANEVNSNFTTVKNFVETLSAGGNFDAGAINTEDIANAAITEGKIAVDAVTTSRILNSAVTTAKIADGAVTTAKIADGAITSAKLAGGAAIPSSIIDAKGDLIAGSAADTAVRVAVGTNGHVLTADSAAAAGVAWAAPVSFNASTTITATNASWPVPTLKSPFVRVTVIGGGGGGGGSAAGSAGGTTTFNAGGAGTVTASGGAGGRIWSTNDVTNGVAGTAGFASANGGQPASGVGASAQGIGGSGNGGAITVAYLNLTGISTVNVTIGSGGAGGGNGGVGGRGEVIVEYIA